MSCNKCCFWPCDRTNESCDKGVYWIAVRPGRYRKIIELEEPLKSKVNQAVLEALEIV